MAATAHSDPYSIFMRKIGYSGGLENTLKRMGDLEAMYVNNRDITLASWNKLVSGPEPKYWGLKTDNIADVFYSLRLIQRLPGDVLVLENLDAMAIISTLLEDAHQREMARAFLMLWAILANDGEIFINMLLAGFEEEQIKKKLRAMLLRKRVVLKEVLTGKEAAKRIDRVITIERQETNRGSAGGGVQSIASLKRTVPLQSERMGRGVNTTSSGAIEFSEDYFRKVPPRRKDWARSLGLWEDKSGLTQKGKEFVDRLTEAGYIDANGLFVFWPMDYELVRAGFRPDLLGKQAKSLWDCLVEFGSAYSRLNVRPTSSNDLNDAVALVGTMMEVVRSHHVRKAMLRREIPIAVAYVAAVACACAMQEPVLNLPAAIAAEQRGERRLVFRRSRNIGGALSLKK